MSGGGRPGTPLLPEVRGLNDADLAGRPLLLLNLGFWLLLLDEVPRYATWIRGRRRCGCACRVANAQKRHSELRRAGKAGIERRSRCSRTAYVRCLVLLQWRIQVNDVNAQKVKPSPTQFTSAARRLTWVLCPHHRQAATRPTHVNVAHTVRHTLRQETSPLRSAPICYSIALKSSNTPLHPPGAGSRTPPRWCP